MVRVTLIPEECVPVVADEEVVKMFGLYKSYIDGSGNYNDIPIPNVKKATLEKVIKFCEHHLVEPLEDKKLIKI